MARPKAFDETTALDAAAQLFWSQGYDGTSMADLEGAMEMGRQSIYNAFGDKRALFIEALGLFSQRTRAMLVAARRETGPLEAIARFFRIDNDFVVD